MKLKIVKKAPSAQELVETTPCGNLSRSDALKSIREALPSEHDHKIEDKQ